MKSPLLFRLVMFALLLLTLTSLQGYLITLLAELVPDRVAILLVKAALLAGLVVFLIHLILEFRHQRR